MNEPKDHYDFARRIIEGPGGMNDYEEREFVVWHVSERVSAAAWTIRCLANPDCEGSQNVIDEIIKEREKRPIGVTEK